MSNPQMTLEPTIEKISTAIVHAMNANGGILESFGIPKNEWPDFENAYKRQFGALLSTKFDRVNLVLRGIPVYPTEEDEDENRLPHWTGENLR